MSQPWIFYFTHYCTNVLTFGKYYLEKFCVATDDTETRIHWIWMEKSHQNSDGKFHWLNCAIIWMLVEHLWNMHEEQSKPNSLSRDLCACVCSGHTVKLVGMRNRIVLVKTFDWLVIINFELSNLPSLTKWKWVPLSVSLDRRYLNTGGMYWHFECCLQMNSIYKIICDIWWFEMLDWWWQRENITVFGCMSNIHQFWLLSWNQIIFRRYVWFLTEKLRNKLGKRIYIWYRVSLLKFRSFICI